MTPLRQIQTSGVDPGLPTQVTELEKGAERTLPSVWPLLTGPRAKDVTWPISGLPLDSAGSDGLRWLLRNGATSVREYEGRTRFTVRSSLGIPSRVCSHLAHPHPLARNLQPGGSRTPTMSIPLCVPPRQPLIQPWGIYWKEHQGLRSLRD